MGKTWSGFMAQNELVKVQWAIMEQCQLDGAEKNFTMQSLAELSALRETEERDENKEPLENNDFDFGFPPGLKPK